MAGTTVMTQVWRYFRVRRKWFLLPLLLVLLAAGALLVFAQGSVLAPLIYTIF